MKHPPLTCFAWVAVATLAALGGCEATDDDGAPTATSPAAARPAAPAAALPSGPWRLVAIERGAAAEEAVGREPRYTIEFGADGRYFGQADCNRYSGGYDKPEPARLAMRGGAATLAACPPGSLSGEFLRAVGAVTRYESSGDRLRLSYGDGVLTFARDTATVAAAAPEVGRTSVYDCDGDVSFTVRGGPGEVALWAPKSLGGKYSVLSLTQTASGARYEEGDTVFWSKGDVATVEIGGQRFVDCRSNPSKVPWADAARRGVTVRALGNEPSWNLEIAPVGLAMITELGTKRAELPYAAPTVTGKKETYTLSTEAHQLVAVVDRTPCVDSMSGEAFDATVTVTFDGAMFYGCGRFL